MDTGCQVILCYRCKQEVGELHDVSLSAVIINEASHDHLKNPVTLDNVEVTYHLIKTVTKPFS